MDHPRNSRWATRVAARVCLLWCAASALPCKAQEAEDPNALHLSAAYTGDWRRNTSGGLSVGDEYADEFDLGASWSSDRLMEGVQITSSIAVMYLGGGDISATRVGDLQGLNNLEAPDGWRLYESWMQMSFGGGRSSLRAGVLDLNAEFDTPVTQGLFTGSPFGIGTEFSQTGVNGPVVWPTTGLGVRIAGQVSGGLQWRFGAYDGVPGDDDDDFSGLHVSSTEGALLIGEVEYSSEHIHKLSLGSWAYTAPFERIDAALLPEPEPEHGNHGVYGTLDLKLGALGPVDFDGALRAGTAPARFNAVDRYVGVAVTASHLLPLRPADSLGLGFAWARIGAPYAAVCAFNGTPATTAETLIELVYRAELTPWLALSPNLQFVREPGALQGLHDSWVVGLRFELVRERSWQSSARRDPPFDAARQASNSVSENRGSQESRPRSVHADMPENVTPVQPAVPAPLSARGRG